MDSDWEVFIAKDDRQRCPDGYRRDEESGQCVDANGNVYEGQPEVTQEQTQEQPAEDQPTDDKQSEEQPKEEPKEQPEEDKGNKKPMLDRINEQSARLKEWISKNLGSFSKLSRGSSGKDKMFYTAVVFPLMSIAKGVFEASGFIKVILEKHKQNKEHNEKFTKVAGGYQKGLDLVYDTMGIDGWWDKKKLRDKVNSTDDKGNPNSEWSEEDVNRISEAVGKRIGELMKTPAIQKIQDEIAEGKDPKETGSIYSAEYGELRALTNIVRASNKQMNEYYDKCKQRKIELQQSKFKMQQDYEEAKRKAAEERRKKILDAKRQQGTADAGQLRNEFSNEGGKPSWKVSQKT